MINQTILIGRLVSDASSKKLENGKYAVYGTLAQSERVGNSDDKVSYFFDFYKIVEREDLAKLLTKGKLVCLIGNLVMKKVTIKDTDKSFNRVSVRVNSLEFLEPKPKTESKEETKKESKGDDLPF